MPSTSKEGCSKYGAERACASEVSCLPRSTTGDFGSKLWLSRKDKVQLRQRKDVLMDTPSLFSFWLVG